MRLRIIVLAMLVLTSFAANASDLPVEEAPLPDAGLLYEVNRDTTGNLYITDWGGGEIWRVDPETSAYARFSGLDAPNEGRPDAGGNIWFTDYFSPILSSISAGASPSLTTWDLSAWDPARTYSLAGIAIDSNGRVWFSEYDATPGQLLYRFRPDTNELCGYSLPGGDHSYYVLYSGGFLWLGDWMQSRIVRFNPENLEATYWALASGSEPQGLAIDASGNIWWADYGLGNLGRLELTEPNQITTYGLPEVSEFPSMIAAKGGKIWYTAYGLEAGNIGVLDPSQASGTSTEVSPVSETSTATCHSLGAGTTSGITPGAGTLDWSTKAWADITPSGASGWTVYEAAGGGYPYGILAEPDRVWVTDQWQQALVRVDLTARATACKQVDLDGDLGTTDDRAPIEGWIMYLEIDGELQEPGLLTGADGCATWPNLALGHSYAVEEDLPAGWTVLTPAHHDFGTPSTGERLSHTFINYAPVQVSACKLEDGDGDPNTTTDQTPIQDWTLTLEIDGVLQEPGTLTGPDGCAAWPDLSPAHSYAVEEDLPEGWTALTPARYDFGTVTPGGSVTHTFVNAQSAQVTACKLEDADGDLGTSDDQTPVEDWTLFLEVDGVRQEPGLTTGPDGCATWNDLAPGQSYAVEEELLEGWTALTSTRHEFGTLAPGATASHTFVNAQQTSDHTVFLPLVVH